MHNIDEKLIEQIRNYHKKCMAVSDFLTDNPEIGGNEIKGAAYIMDFLKEEGYVVTTPYPNVPNSFLAVPQNRLNDTGSRAVFLCEYDALQDIGHACGHSLSCGVSLLGALALNAAYPELPIRIDIMGTPGEESPSYKVILAETGAFDGYEFAAMAHMFGGSNVTCFNTLAVSDLRLTFHGRSSHASYAPEQGINALNAARVFMDAMDMWRQHLPSDCQIHGIVQEGGIFPSIVPDRVVLDYWFRAEFPRHLRDLEEKALNCAQGAALCTGTTFTSESIALPTKPLFSTQIAKTLIGEIFEAMGDSYEDGGKAYGSTDMGDVNLHIPTIHPLVDIAGGVNVPLHDPRFAKLLKTKDGYKGLYRGALLIASFTLQMAFDSELLDTFKQQHREMLAQRI